MEGCLSRVGLWEVAWTASLPLQRGHSRIVLEGAADAEDLAKEARAGPSSCGACRRAKVQSA